MLPIVTILSSIYLSPIKKESGSPSLVPIATNSTPVAFPKLGLGILKPVLVSVINSFLSIFSLSITS